VRVAAVIVLLVLAAGGAFLAGRATAGRRTIRVTAPPRPGSYDEGYIAGREDAFSGYDGGWVLGQPYIVTLRHGGRGITYRFARRWPVLPGRTYRTCDQDIICDRPGP
jgi:hypothetical protein